MFAGRMQRDLAPLGGTIGQQQQIANLEDLQRRARDARLVDQLRRVEQSVKVEASAGAQVSAQLFRELLLSLDPGTVLRGRELGHALAPERRSRISRQQLAELVEFEHALAEVRGWESSSLLFYGTGRKRVFRRSFQVAETRARTARRTEVRLALSNNKGFIGTTEVVP